jgi:ribosomal protein L31
MVAYTCHPSYTGSTNKRTAVQANLGKNVKPYLKKKKKKKKQKGLGGMA